MAEAKMTPTTPRTRPTPSPWDWPGFCAEIERIRGRPLLLAPAELPAGHSSLWVAADDIDLIVYAQAADPTQQLRDITHQAAHMLLGHQAAANAADQLFSHLDPAMVAAVLTVSVYSQADETIADEFASQVVACALAATSSEDPVLPYRAAEHRPPDRP
jgi:hypothetical protein